MLAMAYKRQGKTAEARTALRKIAKPDANVLLQMGLLSLQEGNLAAGRGRLRARLATWTRPPTRSAITSCSRS